MEVWMALLFDPGIFSVIGLASELLVGSKLYWYASGSSTPLATFSDQALTVPNANPVVANADGRFPAIWLQEANYKLILKSALDITLVTRDPIIGTTALAALADPAGSTLVGYKSPLLLTQATTVGAELARTIWVDDIQGVVGDGVHDDAPAIQAFLEANWGTVAGGQNLEHIQVNYTSGKTYKFGTVLMGRQARIHHMLNGCTILCTTTEAFYFTPDTVPSFVESCAVFGPGIIKGASFAAVRCDPGAPFLEVSECEITGNVNAIYGGGLVEGLFRNNYIHDNSGKAYSLVARQVGGTGAYLESQRCLIEGGKSYNNIQGGAYLENGGDHYISTDVEKNSGVNPEIANRNSFGNQFVGMNSEPTTGATAYYYSDDASALVPGRITEGVQHVAASLGGGATYDFQIAAGAYTAIGYVRGGTNIIWVDTVPGQTLIIGPMASAYTISGPGAATAISVPDMLFQGSVRAHAGQAFYVGTTQVVGAQQAAIPNTSGGATVDANCRATVVSILTALRAHGLIAP